MRLQGAWTDALAEAEQASQRLSEPVHPALGAALYEQAELHRLRGDDRAAGDAYRRASDAGHGAQPGLALLRLRQGRVHVGGRGDRAGPRRTALPCRSGRGCSPLASRSSSPAGDVAAARAAADELAGLTDRAGLPADDRGDVERRCRRSCCAPKAIHWAALRAPAPGMVDLAGGRCALRVGSDEAADRRWPAATSATRRRR